MLSLLQIGLKVFFLILIYLFLFVLVRLIAKDLVAARTGETPKRMIKKSPRLVILESPVEKVGRTFPLAQKFTIGRAPENNLFLKDVFISKQHSVIREDNGKIFLHDLESSNGTFLNGERIKKPRELKVGDKIQVGQTTFEFVE
ncbi:MAG TPA: FHA domain-containing protein [Actinobacteria bacterium]|nr:FHA domain-containing protein [Actinomycetota bacterium]